MKTALCAAAALSAILSAPALAQDARYEPRPMVEIASPDWADTAILYQLNTRQFTEEGTFRAAMERLEHIRDLGADVIWLMPIHPIGQEERKGTLGSPYSVADYRGVNPEFGTMEDFQAFVDRAHELGLKVILDWVANHSAWDNPLRDEHPDWYLRDWDGSFRPTPWWDWSDIIDFDYTQAGIREYMTESMAFWVREVGVDGFRADVAAYVPLDFWETAREELDAIKPVFMLAEAQMRDLHYRAFEASYAWDWNNTMHAIAHGRADATALYGYYAEHESAWPREAMRMTYISNHDQNSWDGTQFERFGDMLEPAIVLSVTGDGLAMIYNGQEAGNEKRLEFFERDPIEWREHEIGDLYRSLFALKRGNSALHNGAAGARMIQVENSVPQQVFSFVRQHEGEDADAVFVALNLSGETAVAEFPRSLHHGRYVDHASVEETEFGEGDALELEPWGWRVFVRQGPT
jgi:glycosidase